jgi:hypothetical protein
MINIELNNIINKVREALEEYFVKNQNEIINHLEVTESILRPFSTILIINITAQAKVYRYVTKSVIHHDINKSITEKENQALVEFNILQHLYPNFTDTKEYSVPRPILVLPEIETYIMEFIDGFLLTDGFRYVRYFSSMKRYNNLQRYIYLCGAWLNHFQQVTGIQSAGPDSLHSVVERCEKRLRLIDQFSPSLRRLELRQRVMDLMQNQLSLLGDHEVLVCGRHSDFTPYNVIANKNTITVIDFLGYGIDPLPVDIMKMMIFFEDEQRSITSSASRVINLKKQFIKGYGKLPDLPEPLLILCEAMQRVVSIWRNVSGIGWLPHHVIESRHRVKAHTEWLMNKNRSTLWNIY